VVNILRAAMGFSPDKRDNKMHRKFSLSVCILMGFVLLSMFSCKAKYLEVQAKYDKAKQKKKELAVENKQLKKEISLLSDSLNVIVSGYNNLKPYNDQVTAIEKLKKNFLEKRVPYYLDMKKRQTENPKSKKR
jgi:peptidoglycan hydrolase CwlO-like protein